MDTILAFFTSILILFVAVIASTAFGGLVGWTVGLMFEDTVLAGLSAVGVGPISMFEAGATLGFVSGFFTRSSK